MNNVDGGGRRRRRPSSLCDTKNYLLRLRRMHLERIVSGVERPVARCVHAVVLIRLEFIVMLVAHNSPLLTVMLNAVEHTFIGKLLLLLFFGSHYTQYTRNHSEWQLRFDDFFRGGGACVKLSSDNCWPYFT